MPGGDGSTKAEHEGGGSLAAPSSQGEQEREVMDVKALAARSRRAAKLSLFAGAIVIAALALARDGHPAAASGAGEIIVSLSETSPTQPSAISLMIGAEPSDLYVWIKNLNDPTGASAFQVEFTYGSDLLDVNWIYPDTAWLGSTGRSVACLGAGVDPDGVAPGVGEAYVACNTLQVPPPYGAQGTGVLARITVEPGSEVGLSYLDFRGRTFLIDTPPNPDDMAEIVVKNPIINIQIAPCADFTGDNQVLVADILYVVQRYFTSDLTADLNGDGAVTVADILIAVQQYYQYCPE